MDINEYKSLSNANATPRLLAAADLKNQTPRTLVYGYYSDGTTHHVYLDADGHLHRLLYRELATPTETGKHFQVLQHGSGPSAGVDDNERFLPTKRLYPESCDYEFMRLLRDAGHDGCFTTFNPEGDANRKAHRSHHGFPSNYAGFTKSDGGVDMVCLSTDIMAMMALRPFTDSAELPQRLFDAACSAVGTSGARDFYVDLAKRESVLEVARELSKTSEFLAAVDPRSLNESIFVLAYGRGHYPMYQSHGCTGGVHHFIVNDTPAQFTAKSAKRYGPANPDAQYPQAIVGHVEGLLFTAIKHSEDSATYFSVVQFGDATSALRVLEKTPGLKFA